MPRLCGMPSRHPMPIRWNASTVRLQLFPPVPFSLTFLTILATDTVLESYTLYKLEVFTLTLFIPFVLSLDQNFVFPSLITSASQFHLVMLEMSPLFSVSRINFPSARCETVANLVCSGTDTF
jgi:hypothetical protein